ncbi:2-haloacid dehalogenase [Rhodovulum iodosum]|uniref:2-haloacid dehalogenase n=1 Tax=Rhodovulum iodosum TaxID=68291 RepID=A0ABV3XXJ4_9RHOB|nr:HAD family phosphatase [Rhodovulum robiginosum]RSK38074.1 HAD family phosphatase [Rhodovulum robiginosum]
MPIDAVIFDIGRVLIDWQPERFFDRVIGPERRRAMFRTVDLYTMNDGIDRGDDFRGAVYGLAEAHPEFADAIRLWHDRWVEMASPHFPASVHLLHALRARGVPVFALTNFGVGSFEVARAAYPFLDDFDRRYISGCLKVMKPEPEIYRIVEEDCGLAPECLLFTDDKPENVAAAAARGWATHLFDGPEGWAARLVQEGLLSPEEAAHAA